MKPITTVYPYSQNELQIFRYADLISEFKPTYPISPNGWGLSSFDATTIDGGMPCGCMISSNLEAALVKTELLLLTSFNNYYGEKGNFAETLELALQKNLELIILDPPQNFNQDYLPKLKNSSLKYQVYPKKQPNIPKTTTRKKFNVPVVLIFGEGSQTDKFEVQLALRTELLKKNYRITQIASRQYAEIFGMHSFPNFMWLKEFSETEKILKFNAYLKTLTEIEKPDLIIIGVPAGIVPITEEIHNDFGMLLLEVAAAIEPDLLINTLYNLDYKKDFYLYKAKHSFGKLAAETGCFVLSRTWLDLTNTKLEKKLQTVRLDHLHRESFKVIDPQNKMVYPVVSLDQADASHQIAQSILDRLENNATVNFM